MHAAIKLQVHIPRDRCIQLPEDLPEGQAEIIVLYADAAVPEDNGPAPPRPAKGTKGARRAATPRSAAPAQKVSYFARLEARQPRPLSPEASRALDEADRGER